MSRIGKQPVDVPANVNVTISGNTISMKNSNGELSYSFNPNMVVKQDNNQITVERPNDETEARQLHGLTRTLISNMVVGLTDGFKKELEINGVGYKVESKGTKIIFNLGYSHPIYFYAPDGIKINVSGPTKFSVEGIDKELVGQVAAKLRSFRAPEPYKGKGIKYSDERIIRKAGKTGKK
jgi:large subunit ribosomal protein L6